MRYGFVLDQGACIGCHACTVACKAENDVVLGGFRTWVKWIEHGSFPEVRKSAAVLRCNHCRDAPCVDICPTRALHHRPDGIVDLDRERCIGCASCLQACPYDALHIDDRSGTAAKCHFCAHRIESGLAPACVAVCPEEAIWVVDLDDAETRRVLAARQATVRKPERRTVPQTFYLDADPVVLDPLGIDGSRTLSHAEVPDPLPAPGTAAARAVYDVPRRRPWGHRITAYLVTKALAAGALVAAALAPLTPLPASPPRIGTGATQLLGLLSLLLLALTAVLLVTDLHKPSRFYFLLTRPNPRSWLVRGGWVLMAHGALSVPYSLGVAPSWLALVAIPTALATAVYTAYLFRQSRGRELWCEDRWLPAVLALQAMAAASALLWPWGAESRTVLALYPAFVLLTAFLPPATPAARRAHRTMSRHPAFIAGLAAAAAAVLFPPLLILALALLDGIYLHAGQEAPLS